VQAAGGDPAVDRARRHAQFEELVANHDAVLELRERGNRRVDSTS
jgi:hypothetical protein